MPRIRQNAQQYADADFLKELDHRKIECGIQSDRELGDLIDLCPSSMCKRKKQPQTIRVEELRSIVRVLCPDIELTLKFLGYPSDAIRKWRKKE